VVSEAIQQIKDAERGAEELVRQARAEGKKAIADAHDEAARLLEAMRASARDEEKSLVETARTTAETEASRILAESKSGVEEIRTRAGSKVKDAVAKVLDSVSPA